MNVTINEESIEVSLDSIQNFSQLIHHLETVVLAQRGEVLTHLELNGEELDDQKEADYANLPVTRIMSVKLRSSSPRTLVLQGLQDCEAVMTEIVKSVNNCLQHFESSEDKQAFDQFVIVTDGIEWFSTIFNGCITHFQAELESGIFNESKFIQAANSLSPTLEQILQAYNDGDMTSFTDIIEYELRSTLETIRDGSGEFYKTLETRSVQ